MDDQTFHTLVGRALVDADFRARLTNPAEQVEALREHGIEPTADQLDALNASIASVNQLSNHFGSGVAAA